MSRPVIFTAILLFAPGIARPDVFHMTSGQTDLEMVTVGNPGNPADTERMNDMTSGYGSVDHIYRIGKYEVTAGQYTEFLNAVAAMDVYGLYSTCMADPVACWGCNIQRSGVPGSYQYSVAPDWANRPVNHVSWADAARFVNWLHNEQPTGAQDLSTTEDGAYYLNGLMSWEQIATVTRKTGARYWIPTEDEWYKAAYHKNDGVTGNYFDYATSSDSAPSNVLGNPTDPGNNATFRDYYTGNYTIGSPYHYTEVGAHENSESPYGTFDQSGNLWEWNETAIPNPSYVARGLRGGCAANYSNNLLSSDRNAGYPINDYNDAMGFRVAGVPEPGTITLLLAGVVGVLAWRRRRAG